MVKIANKTKLIGKLLRRTKLHQNVALDNFFLNSHSERPDAGHGNDDGDAGEEADSQDHPESNLVPTEQKWSGGLLSLVFACSSSKLTGLRSFDWREPQIQTWQGAGRKDYQLVCQSTLTWTEMMA